ncbi:XRE family transcriptional regulator [Streptococcus thoraltensis]|uniref:spr1629 family repressor/antitoxin n=1 Tax=Streptococcus thoraltensis TaxID=55085 RepID=UPI001F5A20AF|nr:XRE family transcriptional regulator [Streptococcus thoraltensis]
MYNGEKIEELRLLFEMSRFELARKLEVSEQAIWQFENGEVFPKMSLKLKLAQLFHVDIDYFEENSIESNFGVSDIAFRNSDIISRKIINYQEVYLNTINKYINYLEQLVQFPQQDFYILTKKISGMLEKNISIERIADYSREILDISDDNSDLLYKLEKSGIYVFEKQLNGTEDAYSIWSQEGIPYIILGINKTAVRRNFDLAHELGHLLLHRGVDFESLDKFELQKKESEANKFASYLLLPEKRFKQIINDLQIDKKLSNPDSYINIKKKLNVSIQAMEYRAFQLGLLTKGQHEYFYRLIYKKKYRLLEPLDDDIVVKRPTKVRSIFNVVFDNNLITIEQFLKTNKITLDFLSHLFYVEKSFFEQFISSEINDFSKIIDIKDFKKSI